MTDDLVKRLRDSCYLAFDDGTNDYATAIEAADRIEALETFVHAIAWGPPHIIETLQYVNSLVDKAQELCPREDEEEKPSNVVQFDRR